MENNKNYTWLPEERFDISGISLGTVNKFVDMVLNSEQAQIVLFAQQCKSIINETLKKGFEEGKLKEVNMPAVDATQSANGIDFDVRKDLDTPGGFTKLSSKNDKTVLLCSEKNHISNLLNEQEQLIKVLGFRKGTVDIHDKEIFIESWIGDDENVDELNNPLDILFHESGYWIPLKEYEILKECFDNKNFDIIKFGYIDTKMTLNSFGRGYKMWMENITQTMTNNEYKKETV